MNPDYLLACAIVWRRTIDKGAGLELLEGLDSPDPNVRAFSRALLIEDEENSLRLLEGALIAGVVTPEATGGCIVDILWNRQNNMERDGIHSLADTEATSICGKPSPSSPRSAALNSRFGP